MGLEAVERLRTGHTRLARFWAKVDRSGGQDACWLWTASKDSNGYGVVRVAGTLRGAHRVSWMLAFGDPGSLLVCHHCDVPTCVNPRHLFIGTDADNARDRDAKGRCAHGEIAGGAKLTAKQVAEIRAATSPRHELAERFGVSTRQIGRIVNGTSWAT